MAMNGTDLADAIASALGKSSTTQELEGFGKGIVQHVQDSAEVNNSSGTVTGICPTSGGPLQDGAASSGVISGMSGSDLAQLIADKGGYPNVSTELEDMSTEIVSHVQNSGEISFSSGNITGQCSNTANSPGSLVDGAGTGGTLSGLDGQTLADNIASALGKSSTTQELKDLSTAITDYLQNNAEAEYASGNVTGTCPAGGGPLQGGAGSNGTIS